MAVYKDSKPTKNDKAWYFKFSYKDEFELLSSIDQKDI